MNMSATISIVIISLENNGNSGSENNRAGQDSPFALAEDASSIFSLLHLQAMIYSNNLF